MLTYKLPLRRVLVVIQCWVDGLDGMTGVWGSRYEREDESDRCVTWNRIRIREQ